MRFSNVVAILSTVSHVFAAPTPASAPVRRTIAATMALPDAVSAVNEAVASVSKANEQGGLKDSAILDDIERLLDIIATHVERIRQATMDTPNDTNPFTGNTEFDNALADKDITRKNIAGKNATEGKPPVLKWLQRLQPRHRGSGPEQRVEADRPRGA
ncbi:hypothetical protein VTI74DRAFT_6680 [Chaetomium olivicolor]